MTNMINAIKVINKRLYNTGGYERITQGKPQLDDERHSQGGWAGKTNSMCQVTVTVFRQ